MTARPGLVHVEGRLFVDDFGPFNPRGVSFFTLPWGLQHDEERYHQNLAWCAARRFDFWRGFGKIGGDKSARDSWIDRESNVATRPEGLAKAIDVGYDRYGMRADVALIADNFDGRDPIEAAHALVEVIRSRQQKVIVCECANEDNMPQPEDANNRRVFDVLRAAFPLMPIVSRCAPVIQVDGHDTLGTDEYGYANVLSIHSDRTPPPERQIRQMWDASGAGRASGSFEPPGPWSSGATMDDPMHLAMASVVCSIVGSALYVFHAGAGIRHGGSWDRNRGLPANYWEQANGEAQADAVIRARDLLPGDVAGWTKINGHWPNAPLPARWVWSDGWPEGVSRIYTAERGGEFYCGVIAVKGRSPHPVLRNCRIEVFHPVTGVKLDERELRGGPVRARDVDGKREITGDGDTYTFDGPEHGGLWGYVVKGRYL